MGEAKSLGVDHRTADTKPRPTHRIARRLTWITAAMTIAAVSVSAVCGSPENTPTPAVAQSPAGAVDTPAAQATPGPDASPTAQAAETGTSTGEPVVYATPGIAQLPTPASADAEMLVGGDMWVDGQPAVGEVLAYVGDVQCGRGQSGAPDRGYFLVSIRSVAAQPGCGTPGAEVRITINGRDVNDTIPWAPGMQQPITAIAGPLFARYRGAIELGSADFPLGAAPFVDGLKCGYQVNAFRGTGRVQYDVVVLPDALRPGCGRDGVDVVLRLVFADRPDVDIDVFPWTTRGIVERGTVSVPPAAPGAGPAQ